MLSAGMGRHIRENSILIESNNKQLQGHSLFWIHRSWHVVWLEYDRRKRSYHQKQDQTSDKQIWIPLTTRGPESMVI